MAAIKFYEMIKDMKDEATQAVSFIYLNESPVLQVMRFETRKSGVMKNTIVPTLPYTASSAAYRAFDAEFGTTKAPKQAMSANVIISGGRFEFDQAANKINPEETQLQMESQIRANVRILSKDIFEGTGADNSLYGIDSMIDNWPLWSAQSVACGNAVLTLTFLDDAVALHNVQAGRTFIFLPKIPYLVLKSLERSSANSAYNVNWLPGQWGKDPEVYAGIPIIPYVDSAGNDYFTDATGINGYIVTFGDKDFSAFQVEPPAVIATDTNSVIRSRSYEWLLGTMPKSIKCVTRIDKIKNARS